MAYLYRPFTIDNILIVVDDAVVLYSFDVEVFFLFFSFAHQFRINDVYMYAFGGFGHRKREGLMCQAFNPCRIHFCGYRVFVTFFPVGGAGAGGIPVVQLIGQRGTPKIQPER